MASPLKITADTSPIKKSLLELSGEIKKLSAGSNKVSIFSEKERRFFKNDLNKELSLMKTKLKDNKTEIEKLVVSGKQLTKGSKEELQHRKDIINAYKTQSRLAKEINTLQSAQKNLGGFGGLGGSSRVGGMTGMMGRGLGMLGGLAGGAAVGLAGLGVARGFQGMAQYRAGIGNRVRLSGLGLSDNAEFSPERLARSGLTEQEFAARRAGQASQLGRAGASGQSILQQASFERSFGLNAGAMGNVATSLRATMGGAGADKAQMKLQASVLASGMEDAIGPYLETATSLLSSINENGMSNTDSMINLLGKLTAQGSRTPEQIASAFKSVDASVRGASGEKSAFLQTAFARAGIGGGTIGGTRLAMESGGILGLNKAELEKRGYSPELIKQMESNNMFSGVGERTGAILNQFKASAGMGMDQSIGGVTDFSQMVGLSSMANSVFGTKGLGGFDALKLMEDAQKTGMGREEFDKQLKALQEGEDPSLSRLDKINETLAGTLQVTIKERENILENMGEAMAKPMIEFEKTMLNMDKGISSVASILGSWDSAIMGLRKLSEMTFGGGMGEWLGEKMFGSLHEQPKGSKNYLMNGVDVRKEGNIPTPGAKTADNTQKETNERTAKAIESVAKTLEAMKPANVSTSVTSKTTVDGRRFPDRTTSSKRN